MDFLQKSINLKIDLPKKHKKLIAIGNSRFNFTIYAGYNEGELKFRTDYSSNLNDLENEVSDFKNELSPMPSSKARFLLIADKNVDITKLDSLSYILNQTTIQRIFRVFKNDSINYENNLIWYGDTQ